MTYEGLATEYAQLVSMRRDVVHLGEGRVNFYLALTGAIAIASAQLWPRSDLGDLRFAVISTLLAGQIAFGEILFGRLLDRAGKLLDLDHRINQVRDVMARDRQLPESVATKFAEGRRWPISRGGSLPLTLSVVTGSSVAIAVIALASNAITNTWALTILGWLALASWAVVHLLLARRYLVAHVPVPDIPGSPGLA